MRYLVRDVRRLSQRSTANLYDTFFTRRISAWITAALAPTGVSPNLVTFVNWFVGVGGCVLIAFGRNGWEVFAGVALVHLYAVLDSVDGELARVLGRTSLRGMFLEDWSAYAMIASFPIAVAVYLQRSGASMAVVILAVAFAALGRNVMPALRRAIAQSSQDAADRPADRATKAPTRRGAWIAVIEARYLNHTNIRVVLTILIVADVATGVARIPLQIAFYGYMTALFVREAGILGLALRGDLIEREQMRLKGRGVVTAENAFRDKGP